MDEMYLTLMENGWTMNDIDSMDMIYYLRLLSKKAEKEKKYIDDVL